MPTDELKWAMDYEQSNKSGAPSSPIWVFSHRLSLDVPQSDGSIVTDVKTTTGELSETEANAAPGSVVVVEACGRRIWGNPDILKLPMASFPNQRVEMVLSKQGGHSCKVR